MTGHAAESLGIPCPKCGGTSSKVWKTRPKEWIIRRVRRCAACGYSFSTTEAAAPVELPLRSRDTKVLY